MLAKTSFNPASLFASGEPGVWADIDPAYMYQDDSGTVPVTAPGQTVGLVLDRSGRGNHLAQSVLSSRPIYGIEPFGGRRNLLTYTEQFDNAAWAKTGDPSAVVTPNVAIAPDGTTTADRLVANAGRAQQTITLAATNYVFSCYMKADTGNVGELWLAGATGRATFNLSTGTVATTTSGTAAIIDAGNGWYRCIVVGTSAAGSQSVIIDEAGGGILIWGAQLETGSTATAYQRVTDQWNVTQAGVPSVGYLQFDGSDDWFVSPTITPGTDKAQVFAGVRKLGNGMIAELSVTADANNGSFYYYAGEVGAGDLSAGLRGTQTTKLIGSAATLPVTRVETVSFDTAGASRATEIFPRVNGAAVSGSGFGAADSGTGNFLAYPLYIGRRNGIAFPFNGRLYSLIVRFGANLTADQIAQTENYVNSKTGAY